MAAAPPARFSGLRHRSRPAYSTPSRPAQTRETASCSVAHHFAQENAPAHWLTTPALCPGRLNASPHTRLKIRNRSSGLHQLALHSHADSPEILFGPLQAASLRNSSTNLPSLIKQLFRPITPQPLLHQRFRCAQDSPSDRQSGIWCARHEPSSLCPSTSFGHVQPFWRTQHNHRPPLPLHRHRLPAADLRAACWNRAESPERTAPSLCGHLLGCMTRRVTSPST